jgi:hypothetical protein
MIEAANFQKARRVLHVLKHVLEILLFMGPSQNNYERYGIVVDELVEEAAELSGIWWN